MLAGSPFCKSFPPRTSAAAISGGVQTFLSLLLDFSQNPERTWLFVPCQRDTFEGLLPLGVAAYEEDYEISKGRGSPILVPAPRATAIESML
jgi:hypothetical protein